MYPYCSTAGAYRGFYLSKHEGCGKWVVGGGGREGSDLGLPP